MNLAQLGDVFGPYGATLDPVVLDQDDPAVAGLEDLRMELEASPTSFPFRERLIHRVGSPIRRPAARALASLMPRTCFSLT
jgi:hypothetical protein